MSIQFIPRVSLKNASYATNENAHLIRLEKLKPGCNVRHRNIPDPENYREVYVIKKDHWDEWKNGRPTGKKRRGYSFVEINHGMGGHGGIQPSVRKLVKAACMGLFGFGTDYRIVYVPESKGGAS
jgi:hypothetical protein